MLYPARVCSACGVFVMVYSEAYHYPPLLSFGLVLLRASEPRYDMDAATAAVRFCKPVSRSRRSSRKLVPGFLFLLKRWRKTTKPPWSFTTSWGSRRFSSTGPPAGTTPAASCCRTCGRRSSPCERYVRARYVSELRSKLPREPETPRNEGKGGVTFDEPALFLQGNVEGGALDFLCTFRMLYYVYPKKLKQTRSKKKQHEYEVILYSRKEG